MAFAPGSDSSPSSSSSQPSSSSGVKSVVEGNSDTLEYWFEQLIDHNNPRAGTFKQRYFFSDHYWKGDGSPIILQTPGERPADDSFQMMQRGFLQGKMMLELGAAGVILEHRYWGKSSPVPDLRTQNLQWLTVEQGVEDLKYFAENVRLPFNATSTHPDQTPWILLGCSYSGLLAAYTQEKYSEVFVASYASSAPVQADGDFWEYWEPVEEGMPWNCSSDLKAAVEYMDDVMSRGKHHEVVKLKKKFGLQSLEDDDFANALTYPLITWKDLQPLDFGQKGQALFFDLCDAVETKSDGTTDQSGKGVGLPHALDNWAAYFKAIGPDEICPRTGGACFSTYDYSSEFYTNTSISNAARGWEWLLCTQLGLFPLGMRGSIVSRMLDAGFEGRRCAHLFPSLTEDVRSPLYNTTQGTDTLNLKYGGWDLRARNLFVVNGEFDPWRSASLSSRAAAALVDIPSQEIVVIPNGHHCWDWSTDNAAVDPDVERVQNLGISTIRSWLDEWYHAHPAVKNPNSLLPAILDVQGGSTIALLNDTANSMQKEINRLKQGTRVAMASYVFNVVFSLALLTVLALIMKERALKRGRVISYLMPEAESRAQSTRPLSARRSSSEIGSVRDKRISGPFSKTPRQMSA
ncbi:hypothetical protein FS837_012467 [Tulasnella sp. UAMH 9824]|nr:hypothetical protein FS837_012467 [Tulasnella sp. UAMH 9824]